MKIRITGTKEELEVAKGYYKSLEQDKNVKYVSTSAFYPNRGSNKLFRFYVDIEYKSEFVTCQKSIEGD